MKFIVNIFDKDLIYEFAYKMQGQIVNENDSLIIVSSNDDLALIDEIESKFPEIDYRVSKLESDIYYSDGFDADKMINWGELSRRLSGDRTVVSRNRIPKKHIVEVEKLKLSIETWYSLRS